MDTFKVIAGWFSPTWDAIFGSHLPWDLRWRLLCFQPIALLTNSMKFFPELFSHDYKVVRIPNRRGGCIRAIIFQPHDYRGAATPRPLHIDFHGGAFLGGNAEYDAAFCRILSQRTSAVVISAEYRLAPKHPYPSAHEDAEDVLTWALEHAQTDFNADPDLLTMSGFSAGANLMMIAGAKAKAAVGFYAPVSSKLVSWKSGRY